MFTCHLRKVFLLFLLLPSFTLLVFNFLFVYVFTAGISIDNLDIFFKLPLESGRRKHILSLNFTTFITNTTSNAPICESCKMVKIDDLPVWIVPFLTSLYFEESDQDKDRCVCKSRKLCRFRPYFCIQCEKGHLCKKVFKAGRSHHKHEKLQVRKVTGRNSINVEDIQVLDEDIVADVRDYKYNHKLAFSLLGDGTTHKQTLLGENDKLNREVCKWCGRSTRALNQEPKTLCSLGCALESVFNMTLREIHEVQLGLSKRKNGANALHVPPRDSRITTTTTTTMDTDDNETEVIEHKGLHIVPNPIEISRNALHTSRTFENSHDKHEGKLEEKEEDVNVNVVSSMVDNKDDKLQSDCVKGSLHAPLRTREDLVDKCFETYNSQCSFGDVSLEPSSVRVRSTPEATPKLHIPNESKRSSQRANGGLRQREDARTPPRKMARIVKAPYSVGRKVSIDLDMFHNLCLLAYGEVHRAKEDVEKDAHLS